MSKPKEAKPNEAEPKEEIRVVLFGRTGCGKSATGNTILGRQEFAESDGLSSETQNCRVGRCTYGGVYDIMVVDTPGIYDSEDDDQATITEILKCLAMTSPGPHVFLWVLRADDRFSNRDKDIFRILGDMFGENVKDHVILVFTHVDQLKKELTQALTKAPDSLNEILKTVEHRYVPLSNSTNTEVYTGELMRSMIKLVKDRKTHFVSGLTVKVEEHVERRLKELETERHIDHKAAREVFLKRLEKDEESMFMRTVCMSVGGIVGGALGGVAGGVAGTFVVPGPGSAIGVGFGATTGSTTGAAAGNLAYKKCSIM